MPEIVENLFTLEEFATFSLASCCRRFPRCTTVLITFVSSHHMRYKQKGMCLSAGKADGSCKG
jgi:hypothetical protein